MTELDTEAEHSRPEIILIHGFRGAPVGLAKIADLLRAANFSVYVPAIPPFGGANTLPQYTPEQYAEYIRDYIEDQNIQQPILIGHSMGSTIAAATASFYPEAIHDKLILMSPIALPPAKPLQLMTPLSAYLPNPIVDYVTTSFLYVPHKDRALFRNTMRQTKACSSATKAPKAAVYQAAAFSARYSLRDFTIAKNTLIIAGTKDRLIPKKQTEDLARRLNAQLEFLPETGHLHNYEKPLETTKLILQFLKNIIF